MAVYAKQNYGVPENQYGFIPTTNALMVVFLQLSVTQITKRHPPLNILASGTLIYAIAVGSVALGRGFWGFWFSMVILTVVELIMSPTATTLAANLAPAEMRGRYMSLYGVNLGSRCRDWAYFGRLAERQNRPVRCMVWRGYNRAD